MTDQRIHQFARILVDHSARVKPGDHVAITTTTAALPLVYELSGLILERGAYPHLLLDLPEQEELIFAHASQELLDFTPLLHQVVYEQFDVLLKIRAETNTRALSNIDPARMARRQKALAALTRLQLQRGADDSLRWVSTLFPTPAYAMEADMGNEEYQDFYYRAAHANEGTPDPLEHWRNIGEEQRKYMALIEGHDLVQLRGPNVDLSLSIKDRKFKNSFGRNNLPDGEIYSGPVENSANGWVRFTYPAVYQGRVVEGVELTFKEGKVINARASKNQDLLLQMLDSDAGARYLGEFAIGTNFQIDRFTKNILLDEKIGGSFHLALGAGYPETGSVNKSIIHWDMICDLRYASEILVDGKAIYRNGQFIF